MLRAIPRAANPVPCRRVDPAAVPRRESPDGTVVESELHVRVYRSDERMCDPRHALRSLVTRTRSVLPGATHEQVRKLFVDFGEIEAAIADWVFPKRDGLHPLTDALRGGALSAGRALLGAWMRDARRTEQALRRLLECLEWVAARQLPQALPVRVSEGYAYYALHPETYAIAAQRFVADRSPGSAVCLGIHSIGTSLSGVVAAALDALGVPVSLHSVRPHGHPFDRRLDLAEDLACRLREGSQGCHFLVIDEGPGLSGSSFAAIVRALAALGIGSERIALFPSWNADPAALRSEDARLVWSTHRCYSVEPRDAGFAVDQVAADDCVDFAAGAWRMHVLGHERGWPAVQPQHEVPKAWLPAQRSIVRFAGLGRYGASKRDRAERLFDAGLGSAPESLDRGYLRMHFLEGAPCTAATPALLDRIADHLAFLVCEFPASRSPGVPELEEMIQTNVRLGMSDVAPPDLSPFHSALADAPTAAIDGRMLPHEWFDTGGAYVKVDALDHHADHFFPGIQDAGWDLAAAAFEFRLDRAAVERLTARYANASGDRDVAARLRFYDFAYPAFRLGYATLTRGSLAGSPEAARFEGVIARCSTRLRHLAGAAVPR